MKTRFRYNGGAARTLGGFILAGVAALMLLLALPGFAGAVVFSDVGKSSAEDEAVQYLVAAGVLAGYSDGTFRPGQPVTRGQAAKMVVAQQGVAPASSACRFADVDSTFAAFVRRRPPPKAGWAATRMGSSGLMTRFSDSTWP